MDRFFGAADSALRTLFAKQRPVRPCPIVPGDETHLAATERRRAAALMRVNHVGEVCAQALYQGQALASRNPGLKDELGRAAHEESDHLAWSAERITQLGGRPSVLNPVWYAGSFCIGYVAGRLGDAWNLGFLAETERQVERHLAGHLERLSARDAKTRAIVETMRREEAGHADTARRLGARDLPGPARRAMRLAARVMTGTAYWL
jgi:3-demethoxyubiquinol 3-hydroxylase